jgi:hypothetical protein
METQIEETTTQGTETGFAEPTGDFVGGDVLDTPSLALPKSTPEIHHGTVVSVTTRVSENTGNEYGIITLQSKDNGLTFEFPFYPPQPWFDPANWTVKGFDPSVLADTPAPGKKQTPREAFARSVSSHDAAYTKEGAIITEPVAGKDAPLQLLKKLAAIEGFTLETGTPRPTSGTEYVAVINSLVAGRLDVLFTRKPEKNDDPAFDGRLKVNALYPKSEEDKPNFAKRFASFRNMSEQQ